jgi:hypothetical protein
MALKQLIDEYSGKTEVVLVLGVDENNKQIIKLPIRVSDSDESQAALKQLVGAANVKLQ